MSINIMILDDEWEICDILSEDLKNDYSVITFNDPMLAINELISKKYDILVVDQQMPNMTGLEMIESLKERILHPMGIILLSAFIDKKLLELSINNKLVDYVCDKPINFKILRAMINSAEKALSIQNKKYEDEKKNQLLLDELIPNKISLVTKNQAMIELIQKAVASAKSKQNILIYGETGVGKELFANLIHYKSRSEKGPIIPLDLSTVSDHLIESELFGHVKGAFTGATNNKKGILEKANGGTLFIDEIENIPMNIQKKLLRFLDNHEINVVGGETKKIDVNIISASNIDMDKLVKEGKFREDLLGRLRGITINIPPLRNRRDDIPVIAEYLLDQMIKDSVGMKKRFSEDALKYLEGMDLLKNVRELKYYVAESYISTIGDIITKKDIMNINKNCAEDSNCIKTIKSNIYCEQISLSEWLNKQKKLFIIEQLKINNFNIRQTAIKMKINDSNLHRSMKELNRPC